MTCGKTLLLFIAIIGASVAFQGYRDRIPNGRSVPHPCLDGETWQGVGHTNRLGATDRNQFGIDFKESSLDWASVCNKDSDGDGKTNGEELGDPSCIWQTGMVSPSGPAISHPGVCEPIDSAKCRAANKNIEGCYA